MPWSQQVEMEEECMSNEDKEVQKRYQQELNQYQKQVEKIKKLKKKAA